MTDAPEPLESDPSSLAVRLQELLTAVRSRRRRLSRAKNVLDELGEAPTPDNLDAWSKAPAVLERIRFVDDEREALRQTLVDETRRAFERAKTKVRIGFISRLGALAGEHDRDVQTVAERPLTLVIDPLTMVVDFDAGQVEIRFGKEPVRQAPVDATAAMTAWEAARAELTDGSLDAPASFDLLHRAYRMACIARDVPVGERVDLVDVLVPLATLQAGPAHWRRAGVDGLDDVSRALLAYQLYRLRREGCLQRNGVRLDLGAATGGSTRDRRNVLFVPTVAGEGQFYGSVRFVAV